MEGLAGKTVVVTLIVMAVLTIFAIAGCFWLSFLLGLLNNG